MSVGIPALIAFSLCVWNYACYVMRYDPLVRDSIHVCQAVMIRQQDGLAILSELEQGSTVEMSFSTVQVGR